jgi:hypothetical protein
MAKQEATAAFRSMEARELKAGDVVSRSDGDRIIDKVKRYKLPSQSFRNIKVTFMDGATQTFRERVRVPIITK